MQTDLVTADYIDRIRNAYRRNAKPGELVYIADLRPEIGGYTELVDQALVEMARARQATLIPESAQWTLLPYQREGAVLHGSQDKHLISIT